MILTHRQPRTITTLTAAVLVTLTASCTAADNEEAAVDDRGEQAAVAAATAYQEAVLAEDHQAACEGKTERMRGGTVDVCVERAEAAPDRDPSTTTGPVTTGSVVPDVPATGDHPAGVGVAISYDIDHGAGSTDTAHHAQRVVDDGDGVWRVDQALTLDEAGTEASVAAALRDR